MNLKIAKDDEKMAEYLERKAVISYLKGYSEKELNSMSPYGMITSRVLEKAERALSEMPAADVQPVDRWISTKDRLPDVGQPVLIYYPCWDGDEVSVAKLEDDKLFFNVCGEFDVSVRDTAHWQPLPIVPRKEEKYE